MMAIQRYFGLAVMLVTGLDVVSTFVWRAHIGDLRSRTTMLEVNYHDTQHHKTDDLPESLLFLTIRSINNFCVISV